MLSVSVVNAVPPISESYHFTLAPLVVATAFMVTNPLPQRGLFVVSILTIGLTYDNVKSDVWKQVVVPLVTIALYFLFTVFDGVE